MKLFYWSYCQWISGKDAAVFINAQNSIWLYWICGPNNPARYRFFPKIWSLIKIESNLAFLKYRGLTELENGLLSFLSSGSNRKSSFYKKSLSVLPVFWTNTNLDLFLCPFAFLSLCWDCQSRQPHCKNLPRMYGKGWWGLLAVVWFCLFLQQK